MGGDTKDELAEKDPVEDLGSRACPQRVVSWSQGMGKNLKRFLLLATAPQCDKTCTKINTGHNAAVCETCIY